MAVLGRSEGLHGEGMAEVQAHIKPKRCRVCRREFVPARALQACCSGSCAITYARLGGEKRQSVAMKRCAAAQKREDRDRLRTRRYWAKLAQEAFNAWIRERDKDRPCISCGRKSNAKQNAGHYRSVGAAPQLRFNEDNCHKQCEHCNSYKSGNVSEYRPRLLERIGLSRVESLESNNAVRRFDVDELKAILATYRVKLRELRKAEA
jgi:hypothetical protein